MRLALSEAEAGHRAGDEARISRAWKLFLLLPRILLHRPPRGGKISKGKLLERFTEFSRGQWIQLLTISLDCAERWSHKTGDGAHSKILWNGELTGLKLWVCMGELSAGRQALEGAPVAPGIDRTLRELRNPVRRPPQLRAPLSEDLQTAQPEIPFQLDQGLLVKNLKSARRGAAGGPSDMTAEHLRPLLDSEADCEKYWFLCQASAQAHIPEEVLTAMRMGRITSLQKLSGGISLVPRTIAKQIGPAVERHSATSIRNVHKSRVRVHCTRVAGQDR